MNKKETINLIAVYMGYQMLSKNFDIEIHNSSNESYWKDVEGVVVCDNKGDIVYDYDEPHTSFERLPFETSWDYLMPAINKCYSDDDGYDKIFATEDNMCQLMCGNITWMFEKVVEFIQKQNENNQKT